MGHLRVKTDRKTTVDAIEVCWTVPQKLTCAFWTSTDRTTDSTILVSLFSLGAKKKSARASWDGSIRLCIIPTTQRAPQRRREGSLEERQLAVCLSVPLVWFEHWPYVRQDRCCHLSFARIVNNKLGEYTRNSTKNTSKVLTHPRKGQRYDTDTKYISNQTCQV